MCKYLIFLCLLVTEVTMFAKPKYVEVDVLLSLNKSEIASVEKCKEVVSQVETTLELVNNGLSENENKQVLDLKSALEKFCTLVNEKYMAQHADPAEVKEQLISSEAVDFSDNDKNVNYFSKKADAEKIWTYNLKLSGATHTGNSSFTLIESEVKATGEFASHRLETRFGFDKKKTESEDFEKVSLTLYDAIEVGSLTAALSDQWIAFWRVEYQEDQALGIEHSKDAIAGMGYNILGPYHGDGEKLKISLALGQRERTYEDNTEDNNPITSLRLMWTRPIGDQMSFESVYWYKANLDDPGNDYESSIELGIKYLISDATSCGANFERFRDNMPITGKEGVDSALKFNCDWGF